MARRTRDRLSVFLFDSRSWHFRLVASESGHAVVSSRLIEAVLEMVVMNNRPHTSKHRRGVRRRRSPSGVFAPRRFLLTRNEAAFFQVLMMVVGDRYLISCKVRLADIITCSDRDWKRGYANRISQKHIDFVVSCAQSSRIVAAIELDDRSHQRRERRGRDAFINQLFRNARVQLIRVPARWDYDEEVVTRCLTNGGLFLEKEIDFGSISQKPWNLRHGNPSK